METEISMLGLSGLYDPENIDSTLALMNCAEVPHVVLLASLRGMVATAESKGDCERLNEGHIWGNIALRRKIFAQPQQITQTQARQVFAGNKSRSHCFRAIYFGELGSA